MKKLNVVLVGLGFGGAFVPIYKDYPAVESIGIFDTDAGIMEAFSAAHGIEKQYHSFEEILEDEAVDAVHLVTPIPLHAKQTVAVLNAGKHCACTVPMATSLDEIRDIMEAVEKSGKNYMMMETTLYTRQFFYAREMQEKENSVKSSSCGGRIIRIWRTGLPIGWGCRPCGMEPMP